MRIFSDDGIEFGTIDECNVHEARMAWKKMKQAAEIKQREETIVKCYTKLLELVDETNKGMEEYEQAGGAALIYVLKDDKLSLGNKAIGKIINRYFL